MLALVNDQPPYFADDLEPDEDGLVAIGGALTVDVLLEAYAKGIFPWTGAYPIPWCSPDPRLVLLPEQFRTSRSLRRVIRSGRFEVRWDTDFAAVLDGCAKTPRRREVGTWITHNVVSAYSELFDLGVAHSVEVYDRGGALAGGLYGLNFGRAFFGESMFARADDASKVALAALCDRLVEWRYHFIDCQQVATHLMSLGAVPIARSAFLERLRAALAFPSRHERWS